MAVARAPLLPHPHGLDRRVHIHAEFEFRRRDPSVNLEEYRRRFPQYEALLAEDDEPQQPERPKRRLVRSRRVWVLSSLTVRSIAQPSSSGDP